MTPEALTKVLGALRGIEMDKVAGAGREAAGIVGGALKGIQGTASSAGEALTRAGHPILGFAAKAAPAAAALVAGKKAYDSPTGQRVRYKLQQMKARRAAKRGYY